MIGSNALTNQVLQYVAHLSYGSLSVRIVNNDFSNHRVVIDRNSRTTFYGGFYTEPLSFAFPPAFMKEARFRVAAEWTPDDLAATRALVEGGALSLGGLITHESPVSEAPSAYKTAFSDPACLKMILDWEEAA